MRAPRLDAPALSVMAWNVAGLRSLLKKDAGAVRRLVEQERVDVSAALLPACPSSSSLRPSALLLPPPPTHPLALEASAALSQAQQQHRDADRTPTYPPRTPTHTHSMLQVLCLQETKLQESHVADALAGLGLPGWAATFSCSAEKKGYSGVATLCRQKPLSVVCGIGDAAHDGEGRVITVVRCAAICWGGGHVSCGGLCGRLLLLARAMALPTKVTAC